MSANQSLPYQPTTFVGREVELADVVARLAAPDCRLLTLVGPGGMGKTRLAVEAAGRLAAEFAGGTVFVDLQSLGPDDSLAVAVGSALGIGFAAPESPAAQLIDALRERELLLLLDNFETLLDLEGADDHVALVVELLRAAPGVKLLVTSRLALNLQEEWLYPLQGLPVPDEDAAGWDQVAAVQLFADRARRVRPDFDPQVEREGVVRICTLVDGSPLALELAAAWCRTLTCSEIAAEIDRNLDFLATSHRNVPPRHRSMQAVFSQSWARLAPAEQDVFRKLSVFRGGFDREAAAAVAGADLPLLLGLAEKSLLRRDGQRYYLHELLRQYAAERLSADPALAGAAAGRHAGHYLAFLAARERDLQGGRQREAAAEIERELENVRRAWQWAAANRAVAQIAWAVQAFSLFLQYRSRFLEARRLFEMAVTALERLPEDRERDRALAMLLTELAWFGLRLGQLEDVETAAARAQELYARHAMPPSPGHGTAPTLALGVLELVRGNYAQAAAHGRAALQDAEQNEDAGNRPFAHYLLARAAFQQGDYAEAQAQITVAHRQSRALQDRWFESYSLIELGNVACAREDYEAARVRYRAGYELRRELDDREGMAAALVQLGAVALRQGDAAAARHLYRQSLDLYRDIHDRGGLATALHGLGQAAVGPLEARASYGQALEIAAEISFTPLLFDILRSVAGLFWDAGEQERAVALLALVQARAGADHTARAAAAAKLEQWRAQMASGDFAAAVERGAATGLAATVGKLRLELQTASEPPLAAQPETAPTTASTDGGESPLAEPLTDREREVLALLAEGLTNPAIAAALTVSVGTVKAHAHNIYGKLAVDNRTAAVLRARELGLI